jgi:polyisoprenoid-binding protein YceI
MDRLRCGVSMQAGTYRLGPDDGTLSVRTGRTGAAAKAGHDLVIHVTSWEATLEVGEHPTSTRIELTADAASLRVREGTGGMQSLGDDDKANIHSTIDDEVLKRQAITFHSTEVQTGAGALAGEGESEAEGESALSVRGELTLAGRTRPIAFDLAVAGDGALNAVAVIKQTDWGMKPYSALFGALKVADDVKVAVDAALPSPAQSL